jgi:hypothetical protein
MALDHSRPSLQNLQKSCWQASQVVLRPRSPCVQVGGVGVSFGFDSSTPGQGAGKKTRAGLRGALKDQGRRDEGRRRRTIADEHDAIKGSDRLTRGLVPIVASLWRPGSVPTRSGWRRSVAKCPHMGSVPGLSPPPGLSPTGISDGSPDPAQNGNPAAYDPTRDER